MKAIILIAHGSKKESSNNEFIAMVEQIKEKNDYDFTQAAFLEIAFPNIQTASKSLIKQGVESITFYPYFLNSGKHVLIDIPTIVNQLREENKETEFKLLNHFGTSNKIHQIILNDLIQE